MFFSAFGLTARLTIRETFDTQNNKPSWFATDELTTDFIAVYKLLQNIFLYKFGIAHYSTIWTYTYTSLPSCVQLSGVSYYKSYKPIYICSWLRHHSCMSFPASLASQQSYFASRSSGMNQEKPVFYLFLWLVSCLDLAGRHLPDQLLLPGGICASVLLQPRWKAPVISSKSSNYSFRWRHDTCIPS